jgi:protein tyrosine/serine phosphatase
MWARRGLRILLAVVAAIGVYAGYLVTTANFHTVIAGTLYCSAQPSPEDIALWRQRYGIKTIVNLRGPNPAHDWYRNERAVARGLGIRLIDSRMSSKRETSATDVEELLAILSTAEAPVLIHCRSGVDRSGLAAAFYVAGVAGVSEFFAELQLTPIYGHLPLWFLSAFAMDRSFEMAEPRLGFPDF